MNQRLISRLLVSAILLGFCLSLSAQWVNVTGNLAGLPSECGNLCLLSVVPRQDKIIAGIAQRGLWQTTDGGLTWTPLGQGAGSDAIVNRPSRILYDPAHADVFWESGIYNSSGVYQTTNGGQTFRHLGHIRHNDYVSVEFADPRRRTLLAGGHEQSRTVWKSVDDGANWTNIGATLPEGTKFSSNPLLIDTSTYLVNASGWGKGTGGVYRTADGGATWSQATPLEANGAPLSASDGSIYWMLMYDRGVIRSTNQGQTWIQMCGPGAIKGSMIIELPDGRLAAVAGKGIKVSSDHGANWTPVLEPAPVQPSGLIYAPARQALYVWHWDCGNQVLTNAVWRHDYAIESKPPQ
ncbi:MAG: hypothetical protein HZA90_00580 [Verrucomicrobia bacterium]|nr:hypothetical protein [Verrucomicrobiota bacterium]